MKYASILCIAAAVIVWPAAAMAAPPQLKGVYAVTGTAGCIITSEGFTPAPYNQAICSDTHLPIGPIGGGAPRNICPGEAGQSHSVEGIRIFNGDGTGTAMITSYDLTPPPNGTFQGGSTETATFSFTYTKPDSRGKFTTNIVAGSWQGTISGGFRDGQTVSRPNADVPLDGMVSNDGKTITLTSVTPTVETINYSAGTNVPVPQTRYHMCHRSRVLIWQGN